MVRHQLQPPALSERGEKQGSFHPREAFADTDARSSAEGDIGELRPRGGGFGSEAERIELFGIGKPARVAMDNEGTHQENRTGGKFVAGDVVGLDVAPADGPGGRIEADRFGDDHLDVLEFGEIVESGKALAEDAIE